MRFMFPFSEIKQGSRIVLYGASECGYDFYRQIVSTGYCELVDWVDSQYEWYRYLNLPVDPPAKVKEISFDKVIITAETQRAYESIAADLRRIGVSDSKLYWKTDYSLKGNIACKYNYNRIEEEARDAYLINPAKYLSEDRLDIVIRVAYAKDILDGKELSDYQHLYKKLMMCQNGGSEPTENMLTAFFTEYADKRGWDAFTDGFVDLIHSMQKNGFRKTGFIPIDRNGNIINGAHRIAAAIALGLEAWVRDYPVSIKPLVFDSTWLMVHGFTDQEIECVKALYLNYSGVYKR